MSKGKGYCEIIRPSDGAVVVRECGIANTPWGRMKGLLGRNSLGRGEGLWIRPTNSVHTCFMRFPIDVVFLSREMKVLKVYERLAPWRFTSIVFRAHSVLELAAGDVCLAGIRVGDQFASRFRE